ncbi:heterotrimeric G protein alpha subunit 4 [Mycena rosella]|uniref:Heterotrimeric G protein alpha subunit 4 n=1 Tax=Mycena rosella TaxID=1033263 RepID=A0AAD7GIM9_MYCRO|nr:heterotrimeric G protein alpha subunit 4 [Mycena rosella]
MSPGLWIPSYRLKILLLGSSLSGKSTILKQMRLAGGVPFSTQEIESFRQLVFDNLTGELRHLLDSFADLSMHFPDALSADAEIILRVKDLRDREPFPMECLDALTRLWKNLTVQQAVRRGNEVASPEEMPYFFGALPRLFSPEYVPSPQDIFHLRAQTIGITETALSLNGIEMLVVDVGGVKSERRKWIHVFNDVTGIIFTVNLNGYDMCLIEDRDANQMQDAMTIWTSIGQSGWFSGTPLVLCFTKYDLFEQKVTAGSDIAKFFPDFNGAPGDAVAGLDYFRRRFLRLAQKAGRINEREIQIHVVTVTDTEMTRVFLNSFGAFFTDDDMRSHDTEE